MAEIHYLQNQFDNATKTSSKLMHIIISDHYPKLLEAALTDANLVPLRDRTLPLLTALQNGVDNYLGAKATREAATMSFENALSTLSSLKIKQWDAQIRGQYLEDTPEYHNLLPQGRGPFQNGPYENRLSAIRQLGLKLTGIVPLAATKTDVDAFYASTYALRTAQTGKEEALAAAADNMEAARVAAAWICYRNMGWMMDYYWNDLVRVDNFFEIHLIQNSGSAPEEGTAYMGTVDPASTIEAAARDFSVVTLIRLKNTGTATLKFCRGDVSAIACTTPAKEVAPGEMADVTPDDLGSGQYLNVTNNEPAISGAWEVVVF